jgi:hypothetical protein
MYSGEKSENMYGDIKRMIEADLRRAPRVSVERAGLSSHRERDTSLITAHVNSEMKRHLTQLYDQSDAAEEAAYRVNQVRDFVGLQTSLQLKKHIYESLKLGLGAGEQTFDFKIPNGSEIFGLPYDLDWSVGNGIAWSARADGKVISIPSDTGFSAGGIGFYLTTAQPALVSITPQGAFDYSWSSFADLPFARSRGGMGLTIYEDSNPEPMLNHQPVLWSVSGAKQFTGAKGSGQIADAASPAFGFGTVPLAPALLDMVPGKRYLAWVWCWQISQLHSNDPFIAFLQFSMPFVSVFSGPPLKLH